ncbi:MAG: cation-transporting P-type ATPase [Methanoregula sp.]|jgi:magnesium-transporting ATPase (P-type)
MAHPTTQPTQEKTPDRRMQFHTLPESKLLSELNPVPAGLTSEQAEILAERFGHNDISPLRKRPFLLRFLEHFRNLMIMILLIAALVSYLIPSPGLVKRIV